MYYFKKKGFVDHGFEIVTVSANIEIDPEIE